MAMYAALPLSHSPIYGFMRNPRINARPVGMLHNWVLQLQFLLLLLLLLTFIAIQSQTQTLRLSRGSG